MSTNMSKDKESRPTPQSLPKLKIPTRRTKVEPEEITTSRVEDFLSYCQKHKKAPITRLPCIPPPSSPSLGCDKSKKGDDEAVRSLTPEEDAVYDSGPETLAFTDREWEELDVMRMDYERIKEVHTDLILELQADPRDRAVLIKCRQTRLARERLAEDIAKVWRRREIRRNFRRDANHPKGVENW